MSKKMKQFMMMLLVLVMSISALAVPAAAATNNPSAVVPVQIQLSGTQPTTPDEFVIRVTAANTSFPLPAGGANGVYETTIQGAGSVDLVFNFSKLGVYSYTITQIGCDNADCYHDEVSTYDLTVHVTNALDPSAGRYDVSVVLHPQGAAESEKLDGILYNNRYASFVKVQFGAVKTYNNRTPRSGSFYFQLKDKDGDVIETVSNVGKKVNFTPIVFDKAGTYTYTMSEYVDNRPAVIYDKSVYTIRVKVASDREKQGDYYADVSYWKNGRPCDEDDLIFANKSVTEVPFTGDTFRMTLWISIMVISLAGVVVLGVVYLKKHKDK